MLYFISMALDELGRSHIDTISAAIEGGAAAVQLREKSAGFEELVSLGREALAVARSAGVPLIINDHVDAALEIGADGVHVGQADAPLREARRIMGPGKIVGVSVSTVEEALLAEAGGADYLGVGPIFTTTSKPDALPPIGLEGLKAICLATTIPILAIGGIDETSVSEVIGAGADGIAVIAAIATAPDMKEAAAKLAKLVSSALEEMSCER